MIVRRQLGGCDFVEAPNIDAGDALLFWDESVDRGLLWLDALPGKAGHPDSLDFSQLTVRADVLIDRAGEHWIVRQGSAHIALRVRYGTLCEGPVIPHFRVAGLDRLPAQLVTLRRLLALAQGGRMPQTPSGTTQQLTRWDTALRALDAHMSGMKQREIAALLFGAERARDDWGASRDFLRLRVRRLIGQAQRISGSGYRDFLR